jgi:hypothetical protein
VKKVERLNWKDEMLIRQETIQQGKLNATGALQPQYFAIRATMPYCE